MDRASVPTAVVPPVETPNAEWAGRQENVAPHPASACDDRVAELEFIQAIEAYKKASGRMFPTWSEVLEVLTGLGYVKTEETGPSE